MGTREVNLRHRKLALFSIYFTFFIDTLCWSIVFPIFPPFFLYIHNHLFSPDVSNGARMTLLGFFLMAFSLGQFLGAPIMGEYADRNGRKRALAVGIFVTTFGLILSAWSMDQRNLPLLFIGRLLTGLFASTGAVCLSSISDLSKNEKMRIQNFGYFSAVAGISFIIGAFLGGKLSDTTVSTYFDPSFPLWLAAGLTLINFLSIIFGFKETFKIDKTVKFHFLEAFSHIKTALKTDKIKGIYGVYFLFLTAWAILFQFISVLTIAKFGFTNSEIGYLAVFMGGCWILGSGYLNRTLGKFFKTPHILEFCLIGFAILCSLVIFPHHLYELLIVIGLSVILGGVAWPICVGLISGLAPREMQGKILGLSQSVQSLALTVAAVIGGLAFHGTLALPFLIAGGVSISAVILYFSLKYQ